MDLSFFPLLKGSLLLCPGQSGSPPAPCVGPDTEKGVPLGFPEQPARFAHTCAGADCFTGL